VALGWWSGSISSSHADLLSLFGMLIVIVSAINVQLISARVQRKAALMTKALNEAV